MKVSNFWVENPATSGEKHFVLGGDNFAVANWLSWPEPFRESYDIALWAAIFVDK